MHKNTLFFIVKMFRSNFWISCIN